MGLTYNNHQRNWQQHMCEKSAKNCVSKHRVIPLRSLAPHSLPMHITTRACCRSTQPPNPAKEAQNSDEFLLTTWIDLIE
jgi:hypothetical protein